MLKFIKNLLLPKLQLDSLNSYDKRRLLMATLQNHKSFVFIDSNGQKLKVNPRDVKGKIKIWGKTFGILGYE